MYLFILVVIIVKKTDLVVKSNRLIEASYRLTLVEQQLILFTIVQARENQTGLFPHQPCEIRVADFAQAYGVDMNLNKGLYDELKEAIATLFKRSVTIHEVDKASGLTKVTETRWVSSRSYIDGNGYLSMIFAPNVIPLITRLEKEFTSYKLAQVGKLSSVYAVRLYELLVQHLEIGKREISVAWLRDHFELADTYHRIVDFKKKVIDISVKQINTHTALKITYSQVKTGRNVTSFLFSIKKKTTAATPRKDRPELIDDDFIAKNARPGESFAEAKSRLFAERATKKANSKQLNII